VRRREHGPPDRPHLDGLLQRELDLVLRTAVGQELLASCLVAEAPHVGEVRLPGGDERREDAGVNQASPCPKR
jgi:hypothetical protein